jgi:hypothetical protein
VLTTGKTPHLRSVVIVGLLLHALSRQLAAQSITEFPTPTPTDTPPPTPTATPLPTHGTQGQCKLMSCSSTSLASCAFHTGPICNTDADCPGSQLWNPVTYQPVFDQIGKPVLTNKGTCPSWKCSVCRASPSAGTICRFGPACGSDAECPASQAFDPNGGPIFDPNGNPVMTNVGTCPIRLLRQ